MPQWWQKLSSLQRIGIVAVVLAGAPFFIAGAISGAKDSGRNDKAAPSTTTTTASPSPSPTSPKATTRRPLPGPTFTYPGDKQCAITYADRGDGTMYWTVITTVAGEVITHASDRGGTIYRHDQKEPAGSVRFFAGVPLSQINDVGGNLDTTDGRHFGCSVRPAS